MSTKPKATKPDRSQATFEKLPEETKDLMKLKDQQAKTTGTEQAGVTKKINAKGKPPRVP